MDSTAFPADYQDLVALHRVSARVEVMVSLVSLFCHRIKGVVQKATGLTRCSKIKGKKILEHGF